MKHLHYAAAAALLLAAGCQFPGARFQDLRDCARASVGVGTGVAADVRVGTFTWPAIGTMSKTYRVGFENRRIAGYWYSEETPFPIIHLEVEGIPLLSPPPIDPKALRRDQGARDDARAAGRDALGRLRDTRPNTAAMDRAREASSRARAERSRARAASNGLRPEASPFRGSPQNQDLKLTLPEDRAGWTLSYKRHDERVESLGVGIKRVTHITKRGYWHPWHPPLRAEELGAFNTALDFEVGVTLGVVSARAGVNLLEIVDFVFGLFWCDIAQDDGG